jgi:tetratricopeptide (TPR) repeat protein
MLATALAVGAPASADVGSSMRRGLALQRQGKHDEALKAFQEALVLEPDNIRIRYDMGRALYEKKEYPQAAEHFQLGVLSKSKALRAKSLYNLGNCQYRQERLDEAIASYTLALLQRPGDPLAKQNLEYCLKMREQRRQSPDSTRQQSQPDPQRPRSQPRPEPQSAQAQEAPPRNGAIGREQADRMLQALQRRERENLEKQPPQRSQRARGGKDW